MKYPISRSILIALVCVGGVFAAGFYAGSYYPRAITVTGVENLVEGKPDNVDFSLFWRVWNEIDTRYVVDNGNGKATSTPAVAVKPEERMWGAVAGMVKALGDPYTVFLTPKQTGIFQSDIRGQFEGVGMEIGMKQGLVTVVAPLADSPAMKAGIRSGDRIIAIDGENATELTVDEAVQKIRGPRGTSVTVSVISEDADAPRDVKITRALITIPTIETVVQSPAAKVGKGENPDKNGDGLRDDGVFVIRLHNFGEHSPEQFAEALRKFLAAGSNKLIIDLRGNPGGYLEAAVDIASWFLPKDTPVVIEKFGKEKEERPYLSRGYDAFSGEPRVVVLVDSGSASASEILAGALSEGGKAKIVGSKTFGKGSVQEFVPLGDAALKVTIARWYTPKGHSISGSGIVPDVIVPFDAKDREAGRDPQFDRAVKLLTAPEWNL